MSPPSLESLAGRINREHQAALEDATSAVAHARLAGRLLLEARERCERGQWETWLGQNCSEIAERTAQQYMRVARHPEIEAGSISEAVLKLAAPRKPNNPHGHAGPQESDSSQNSPRDATARPQPPQSPPQRGSDASPANALEVPSEEDGAPDAEEIAASEAALIADQEAMAKLLKADDKLAWAMGEVKRLSGLLRIAEQSRDEALNGKGAMTKLLKIEQRKVERLTKELKKLESENEALRERVAISQERAA